MSEHCPNCSAEMGDADVCPQCGTTRLPTHGLDVTVLAHLRLDGDVLSGAAQHAGVLFAPLTIEDEVQGSRFARVLALDLKTMAVVWQRDFLEELLNPPFLVLDDLLIFATRTASAIALHASLHAFDAASGEERWCWQPDMRALSAPALARGLLWTVGRENSLWSLDYRRGELTAADGQPWSGPIELGGTQQTLPAAARDDLLLVPTIDATLIAVDVTRREIRWRYRHKVDAWVGTPLICGNCVVIPFTDGSLALVDANFGTPGWIRPPSGRSLPSLTSNGEILFVGDSSGIVALSLANGTEIWRRASERKITAMPVLHENALIVAGHDHTVKAFDPYDGDEIWRWQGERRIEADPVLTPAGLAILDAGNNLTVLQTPRRQLSPQQAIAAGEWQLAAILLAEQGEHAQAAELLDERDDSLGAARLWLRAGDTVKAIEQFAQADLAEGWEAIATLQEEQGDWNAKAVALHRLAELQDSAEAWLRARQAYLDAGMNKEAAASWREICRLRNYPFVHIEAIPEAGFVKDQFNILRLIVHNEGPGIAAALSARASGTGFTGEHMETRELGNIGPGNARETAVGPPSDQRGESTAQSGGRIFAGPARRTARCQSVLVCRRGLT